MKALLYLILVAPIFAFSAEASVSLSQIIDVRKVFTSSPFIYTALSMMSIVSMALWLYTLATFRGKDMIPKEFLGQLRLSLESGDTSLAEKLCLDNPSLLSAIVKAGITTRNLGPQVMMDAMKTEGKRAATPFWQRLSLLNDIAIVAPMLGLLGTVIGMFYAFYDVNRSVESINALFDGLGIAVGTTVVGLIVAILAMIFATTLKYRLVKTLSLVENEALGVSALIPRQR
jgi:biopolymer transport protein ExbB